MKRLNLVVTFLLSVLNGILWGSVLLAGLTGCVRNIDAWGLKMEFAEGLDFHAGANSIDKVDDRRGVSPGISYAKGQ